MKDPNDTRDIGLRPGSPLWIHMTGVTAAGIVVLALAISELGRTGVSHLAHSPALNWLRFRPGPAPRMACMSITREEVAHLARLSRLALSDEELDRFAGQLDVIIAAVARVGEVAADGIPPTTHAVPVTNVFRDDTVVPPIGADAALSQAPSAEQGRFRVPRILAED